MWSYVALTVSMIIGSGIFRSPASVASAAGSVEAILAVWAVGGFITICLGLCLAELAAMLPQSGGLYVYMREAFGPGMAFIFGWTFMLINPASWAAIAVIFGDYLTPFLRLPPEASRWVATGGIIAVCLINFVSVRYTSALLKLISPAKVIALLAIALGVFILGDPGAGAFAGPHLAAPSVNAFGVALVAVLWPYEGVAASCAAAGEARDPGRTLPRAIVISVLVIAALYITVNVAYLWVLPVDKIAGAPLVAADAMRTVVGPSGFALIAGCAVLTTVGALLSTATADPRVFFAMAKDRLFFQVLGRVNPRFKTPDVAILLSAALAIAYVWVRTFEQLASSFVLGMWVFYGIAVVGLIRMRFTRPEQERPYRVWLYPVTPIVFLLGTALLIGNSLFSDPTLVMWNVVLMLAGLPVYFLWKRNKARTMEQEQSASIGN
jgi:APA family basic amino acid/polyamine antiporter